MLERQRLLLQGNYNVICSVQIRVCLTIRVSIDRDSVSVGMRRAHLPLERLKLWALLNGIVLCDTIVKNHIMSEDVDKGAGLVATTDAVDSEGSVTTFISLPGELVLSKERVYEHAKSDLHLREVLHAVGPFAQVRSVHAFFLRLCIVTATDASGPERSYLGLPPAAVYPREP